jgi:hypothetical protein
LITIVSAFGLFLDPAHLDQEIVLDNKGSISKKNSTSFFLFFIFLLADEVISL